MDMFWDMVDAARRHPAVAVMAVLAVIVVLGAVIGFFKIAL